MNNQTNRSPDDFENEFTDMEQMNYLIEKRAWLAKDGKSLRKAKLETLVDLMLKNGVARSNIEDRDDSKSD